MTIGNTFLDCISLPLPILAEFLSLSLEIVAVKFQSRLPSLALLLGLIGIILGGNLQGTFTLKWRAFFRHNLRILQQRRLTLIFRTAILFELGPNSLEVVEFAVETNDTCVIDVVTAKVSLDFLNQNCVQQFVLEVIDPDRFHIKFAQHWWDLALMLLPGLYDHVLLLLRLGHAVDFGLLLF